MDKQVGDVFTEDGQEWKVVKVDTENGCYFASKVENGKTKKGRPHKFLVVKAVVVADETQLPLPLSDGQ